MMGPSKPSCKSDATCDRLRPTNEIAVCNHNLSNILQQTVVSCDRKTCCRPGFLVGYRTLRAAISAVGGDSDCHNAVAGGQRGRDLTGSPNLRTSLQSPIQPPKQTLLTLPGRANRIRPSPLVAQAVKVVVCHRLVIS